MTEAIIVHGLIRAGFIDTIDMNWEAHLWGQIHFARILLDLMYTSSLGSPSLSKPNHNILG